jgi:hypothetical protein
MAVSAGERLLAAEWVLVTVVQTGDALAEQSGPTLPNPGRYFATMIAFLFLAGLALFGPNASKFAGRFGALVTLVVFLAPSDATKPPGPGNRPLILRFLRWLAAFTTAGANNPTNVAQGAVPGATVPGSANQYGINPNASPLQNLGTVHAPTNG